MGLEMLTDGQVRQFRRDGYIRVGPVASGRDLARLRAEAAQLVATAGTELPEDHVIRSDADESSAGGPGHVRVALHLCHLGRVFRAHALNREVVSAAHSILGEQPVVLTSLLFHKPAMVGQALLLHQDLPYYPYLGDDDLVTCWTALDETGPDNGCVEYLPGSHHARLPHGEAPGQPLQIDAAQVATSRLVSMPLQLGEAVMHHGLTVHRSAANHSEHRRLGLATLYIRSSANIKPDDFPYPLIATGR